LKIASPKLHTAHLSANDEAVRRCEAALEQYDKGDYEGAQEIMRRLWRGVGERPQTKGLHPSIAAEVLLCVGILTGWIGSQNQPKSGPCSILCLLQLLPDSFIHSLYSGDGERPTESRMDSEGVACSVAENMTKQIEYAGHQNQRHTITPLPNWM
jgi:hypothetical protein